MQYENAASSTGNQPSGCDELDPEQPFTIYHLPFTVVAVSARGAGQIPHSQPHTSIRLPETFIAKSS
jgi:hypothetical protein